MAGGVIVIQWALSLGGNECNSAFGKVSSAGCFSVHLILHDVRYGSEPDVQQTRAGCPLLAISGHSLVRRVPLGALSADRLGAGLHPCRLGAASGLAQQIAVWIVGGRAALPGADAVLVWLLRLRSHLHESLTEAQADQCGNLTGSV